MYIGQNKTAEEAVEFFDRLCPGLTIVVFDEYRLTSNPKKFLEDFTEFPFILGEHLINCVCNSVRDNNDEDAELFLARRNQKPCVSSK